MQTFIKVVARDEKNVVVITGLPEHIDMQEVIAQINHPLQCEFFDGEVKIIPKDENEVWSEEFARKIANSILTAFHVFTVGGFSFVKFGV